MQDSRQCSSYEDVREEMTAQFYVNLLSNNNFTIISFNIHTIHLIINFVIFVIQIETRALKLHSFLELAIIDGHVSDISNT